MEERMNLYCGMGISSAVYNYGEKALEKLIDRFAEIDKVAE